MAKAAADYEFTVRWHPFLLRPGMPADGKEKAPDTPDNPRVNPRMKAMGLREGIDFTGLCDRYPNSVATHCALYWADQQEQAGALPSGFQDRLSMRIFKGYFTLGEYPDVAMLVNAATELGLAEEQAAELHRALESGRDAETVQRAARSYSQRGISGVPFFFFNGEPAFSGAQDERAFLDAFAEAAEN